MRILLVTNVAADRRLGAARVYIEFGEALAELGHDVGLLGVGGHEPRTAVGRHVQIPFWVRVTPKLHRRSRGCEVIDAVEGTVVSRQQLGSEGLLVSRSVGLSSLYRAFVSSVPTLWPEARLGHPVGRAGRAARYWTLERESRRSWWLADLINVPNRDEHAYLARRGFGNKTVVVPYGLASEHIQALARSAASPRRRLAHPEVAFIGIWGARKGAFDWGRIIRNVWAKVPETRFSFLGTWYSQEVVLRDLGLAPDGRLRVVESFAADALPGLLSSATVGALPSYIEGFGLAVLEHLAAGQPVVAYDVPGPRETVPGLDRDLLVPAGDVAGFAERLVRVLTAGQPEHAALSHRARTVAAGFSWPAIAARTAEIYERALAER